MTRMMGGAALVAAVLTISPLQANAQMGGRGQRAMRDQQARPGVEMIMRMREQLQLTEGQLGQLDDLRKAVVQHRAMRAAQREELRSQRMAAPRDRDALREEAEARRAQAEVRREEAQAFSQGIRDQVESILNDDQKAELQNLAAQARAYQRGRADGMRGQQGAVRQGRGAARGRRGAMGPGMRRGDQRWGPRRGGGPGQARGFRRGGGDGPYGGEAPPPSGS